MWRTWGFPDGEYSPSVPSGSTALEVRAANKPADTGRRTSPGSWRQGNASPGRAKHRGRREGRTVGGAGPGAGGMPQAQGPCSTDHSTPQTEPTEGIKHGEESPEAGPLGQRREG